MTPPDTAKISASACKRRRRAFSLVEVTMAMGIFTFAITGITGLLSIALQSNREAMSDVDASAVASRILGERRSVAHDLDSNVLPKLTENARRDAGDPPLFLDAEGNIVSSAESADYRVFFTIQKEAANPRLASINLELISPASAAADSSAARRFLVSTALRVE